MFILAFLIFFSLIAIYGTIAAAILYHIKKFEIDQPTATHATILFVGVSSILLVAAGVIFFTLPWSNILPETMPILRNLPYAF